MFIVTRIVLVAAALIWMRGPLMADPVLDTGGTDSEIRVGNIMPYTGPSWLWRDRKGRGRLFRHDQRAWWNQRSQDQVYLLR